MIEEFQQENEEWLNANPFLVNEWRKRGIETRRDIRTSSLRGGPLDGAYTDGLLASLDHAPSPRFQLAYIRMLSSTKHAFPAELLIRFFDGTDNYPVRSAVMQTLAYSNGPGRFEWFAKLIADPAAGDFQSLAAGYCSELPEAKLLLPLLREHFASFPINAIQTFDDIGGEAELDFLKQLDGELFGYEGDRAKLYRKLYEKVVGKIGRRLERARATAARRAERAAAKKKAK